MGRTPQLHPIHFSIPMQVNLQGVCTYLNLGITEHICGIRNREEAATRINLCLNGISLEEAYHLVDTNGNFIVDEMTGRIKGIPGIRVPEAGTPSLAP